MLLMQKVVSPGLYGINTRIQTGDINVEYKDKDDENTGTDGSQSQKAGAVETTGEDASETYTDID